MKMKGKLMKVIGYIVVTIGLMFYTSLINAFVLCKLWGWFITPAFNLPNIEITTAIGISMIIGYLTQKISTDKTNNDSYGVSLFKGFFIGTIKPCFALLFGWIVTWFM